ncbi:biliverdin-producing heme oxygenase [Neolewinella antarctica]|uniref:Heme oxygenase n=1 Tax=Neolewinella antarctica TaxID=442734 RepID=A0ABX0XF28_9BACT|nr:biliverdin-producing heme oxygenase [Neolewinella antarctica]NJC27822.1 heme oxygenase [Neolewinella antarctica]
MSTPIGTYLKQETRAAHVATEALLLGSAIRDRSVSLRRYRRLILVTERVWRSAAQLPSTTQYFPNLATHVTTLAAAVDRDRALLGLPKSPPATEFPLPKSRAETLGMLYVLLGSTLGGRMIAGLLGDCPELAQLNAHHFYGACADLPRSTWGNFQRLLTQEVRTAADREHCLAGALATFGLYPVLVERSGLTDV